MKAALISLGSKSSLMTIEAMSNYFDEVDMIDIREIEISVGNSANGVLYKGKALGSYDCVYIKGSYKYATIQRSIASHLQNKCYIPFATSSFSIVHDKLLTHLELECFSVPMPKTYISSTPKAAKNLLEKINYPIILKIPNGTQGKGVMFAESFATASSILDTLETLKQPFIIQEYIETNGTDIRALVVGDKVVASMKRTSSGKDMRSNLHAGGSAEAVELDAKTRKAAINAAKALKADICGVDILLDPRGPLVLEANLSPGLQGITKATGLDVADIIARFLAEKTEAFLDAKKKENNVDDLLNEEGIRQTLPSDKELNSKSNCSVASVDESKIDESSSVASIITNLNFRGNRILLPEVVTKVSKFDEDSEYVLEYEEGKVIVKKF